jgi:hypothetical protein
MSVRQLTLRFSIKASPAPLRIGCVVDLPLGLNFTALVVQLHAFALFCLRLPQDSGRD